MALKPSERPEHSPRGYEWLPDAYERDVKLHGPEARETVRQALAEGDFEALLLDTIGEQYPIPHRMWRKANLEQNVYPRFESGWIRMRLATLVGSGWVGPYVEGWIFVPEGALKKVLQERPSADQSARDTLPDPYTTGFPGRPPSLDSTHTLSVPKVAVQIAEGREIGKVAGQLYQALSDGLLVAEAEIHRIYNEPIRGGEVFKFHLEWPRIEKLSRDWWAYGRARIAGPGTNAFESEAVPVASVFPQLIEELAKEGMEGRELTLSKPYGNRAGGHPNDLDLATKIRCLRSDVERIFGEAVRAKMTLAESVDERADTPTQGTPESGTQSSPSVSVGEKTDAPDPNFSGYPGRPSKAKHLIEQEFRRRAKEGELCPTLPEEASALLEWLEGAHPAAALPTVKTIKNNLRGAYNREKLKQRPK